MAGKDSKNSKNSKKTVSGGQGGQGAQPKRLPRKIYENELFRLQAELVKLQEWVRSEGARVVVIFEGRDAAGKGSTIKRVTEYLNPRIARIAALPAPTERERTQWYFQRYIEHLPAGGQIVLFDRSWYNRAGVEHVMGFCTKEEYHRFLHQCPIFERLLVEDGILLRKYWFSVSDAEQERRSDQHDRPLAEHHRVPRCAAATAESAAPPEAQGIRAGTSGDANLRHRSRRQAHRSGRPGACLTRPRDCCLLTVSTCRKLTA